MCLPVTSYSQLVTPPQRECAVFSFCCLFSAQIGGRAVHLGMCDCRGQKSGLGVSLLIHFTFETSLFPGTRARSQTLADSKLKDERRQRK